MAQTDVMQPNPLHVLEIQEKEEVRTFTEKNDQKKKYLVIFSIAALLVTAAIVGLLLYFLEFKSSSSNSSSSTPDNTDPVAQLTGFSALPLPDVSVVGVSAVKTWSSNLRTSANNDYVAAGLTHYPSPTNWGKEVIYSIQVDRFNDGDTTNNNKNIPSYQSQHSASNDLSGLPQFRHGGDLQGIINRLGYISYLGASTLWITPILKHDGSYHGYCTVDPTDIDTGFGSKELFRSLVQQAHALGIKVVLDVVINHLCDYNGATYYSTPTSNHQQCATDLGNCMQSNCGNAVSSSQGVLSFSSTFFPPFKSQYFFNKCGPNSGSDTSGQSYPAIFGDFVQGMNDYNTLNWDWQTIFTDIHLMWIAYADIDGFRLDAAKHVSPDFLSYFSTSARAYARSLGKNNFLVIGEVAASANWEAQRLGNQMCNPSNPISSQCDPSVPLVVENRLAGLSSTYLSDPINKYPGLGSVYNFEGSGSSVTWLQQWTGGALSSLASFLYGSDYYTVSGQGVDYHTLWTMLEIHDWPRFLSQGSQVSGSYSQIYPGLAYLLTTPGSPIIYYGLEQGFTGHCNGISVSNSGTASSIQSTCNGGSDDSLKRQDMFVSGPWKLASIVPSINSLSGIGLNSNSNTFASWKNDPFLDTSNSVFNWARTLTYIRKSCSVLTTGNMYWRYTDPMGKLAVYSLLSANNEIVVAINVYTASLALPSSLVIDYNTNKNRNGGTFVNILGGAQSLSVVANSGGVSLNTNGVSVPAAGTMIFVWSANVDRTANTYNTFGCTNGD